MLIPTLTCAEAVDDEIINAPTAITRIMLIFFIVYLKVLYNVYMYNEKYVPVIA